MKLSGLQQSYLNRRNNSFRSIDSNSDSSNSLPKSPPSILFLLLHCLGCLVSLILGFRFSRLLFFLLISHPSITNNENSGGLSDTLTVLHTSGMVNLNKTSVGASKVVVGRHGILIRPWPHPNPTQVMTAHQIIDRVQHEQRVQYGVKNPRTIIAVTPTYVRTFQTLHLTGVMHSLMNVPYNVVWVVVEAGGVSNETASLIAKSGLRVIHVGFQKKMPVSWEDRHKVEIQMRMRALRIIREQKLDGLVMFADDSNMHSMELFDEIQNLNWIGAVSVGILAHSGNSGEESVANQNESAESSQMPVQGPACNSSDKLIGWHTFNSQPYIGREAKYIGDMAIVLPRKLEWSGFVLNSRLFWEEDEDKPEWVKDFDSVAREGDDIESPLSLLKDPSGVEPLGSCGRKVLLWWLRVEARADSKFPPGWIIDPPLEITVPAKHTPWPEAIVELQSSDKAIVVEENKEKRLTKTRTRRPKRSSKTKKKRDTRLVDRNTQDLAVNTAQQ